MNNNINPEDIEEVKELLEYAIENRHWLQIEEAIEILRDILGYENEEENENTDVYDITEEE